MSFRTISDLTCKNWNSLGILCRLALLSAVCYIIVDFDRLIKR